MNTSPLRLRNIPTDLDRTAVAAIDGTLARAVDEEGITIGLAVESGSRAWGFPSPDSDYDGRFIFVRSLEDYLSPWQKRDVIEIAPEGELDLNGWDLAKTLKLLVKGNAVAIEWLMSSIVYDGDAEFRADIARFATEHSNRIGIARHYLHLGSRQRRTYFADGKQVAVKKLFYALRPAAALRWLRLHPSSAVAPMHFPTLMLECDPPADVHRIAADLIARKAETRELGSASVPGEIERFIDAEFAIAAATLPPAKGSIDPNARIAAESLFRRWVTRFDNVPGSTREPRLGTRTS